MDNKVDIREFAKQIIEETKNGSTSNKALLWVTIASLGVFTLLGTVLAVIALFVALQSNQATVATQKELSETKFEMSQMKEYADNARRAYDNARKTRSRALVSQ